ncbi:hypothetical protein [Parabacteroides sp. FAFU027]|uniref:hypothetical protein n=1 Tax=Parabacteroides sp. FAFU027 TaxID=2922715 RepID=UPI001FB03D51|nr:hypothetical protein [Parabacteroides sp. FAFU027]
MNAILSRLKYYPGMKTLMMSVPIELKSYFVGLIGQTPCLHPDLLIQFVRDEENFLHTIGRAIQVCSRETIFWIVYPKVSRKGHHGLNQVKLADHMSHYGYKPYSHISIDHNWTGVLVKHL